MDTASRFGQSFGSILVIKLICERLVCSIRSLVITIWLCLLSLGMVS